MGVVSTAYHVSVSAHDQNNGSGACFQFDTCHHEIATTTGGGGEYSCFMRVDLATKKRYSTTNTAKLFATAQQFQDYNPTAYAYKESQILFHLFVLTRYNRLVVRFDSVVVESS